MSTERMGRANGAISKWEFASGVISSATSGRKLGGFRQQHKPSLAAWVHKWKMQQNCKFYKKGGIGQYLTFDCRKSVEKITRIGYLALIYCEQVVRLNLIVTR
ncbi:hypothetical protein HQ393_10065 [Chitinibacter bivalviorum]|uniref:Uncharacterized protein n=1 Tax=Chitinibacter bivalviorum TaxID=2739434 RepID=A0A7H9BJB2_9NEIS|nr:hypothetical protein HQ393_10065 [Chitinibacter bivalviorum]